MRGPSDYMVDAHVERTEVSAVLRNTYGLLALTLAFSALVAFFTQQAGIPRLSFIGTLIGFYGLFFLTAKLQNSGWGLLAAFALTGFMGFTIGPLVGYYLKVSPDVVLSAFTMTAVAFAGLSAFVLITRKDMSFLSGFLVVGFFVLLAAVIGNYFFFQLPAMQIAISAGFVLFSSAAILFETSNIIHGGERNYIMATVSLFVSIYNMFVSLLSIFGFLNND